MDGSLPLDLSSTPKIFNVVADHLALCDGMPFAVHYLKDYLVFVPAGSTCGLTANDINK